QRGGGAPPRRPGVPRRPGRRDPGNDAGAVRGREQRAAAGPEHTVADRRRGALRGGLPSVAAAAAGNRTADRSSGDQAAGPGDRPPDPPDALAAPQAAAAAGDAGAGGGARFRLVLAVDAHADTRGLSPRRHPDADHVRPDGSQSGGGPVGTEKMARKQNESRIADLPTQTIPAVPDHLSMAAARKIAALKEVGVLFVE